MRIPFAFFDVDDTLIKTKSMFSFFEYWCEECCHDYRLLDRFKHHFEAARRHGVSREKLNRDYYEFLAGCDPRDLIDAGEQWAQTVIENQLFYQEPVEQLRELARQGAQPVFVSGSFSEVLEPLASHLGVRDILCTQIKLGPGGFYTGEIGDPQTIGSGKAVAISQFLQARGCSGEDCWAFGDDISDLPMLECVGHPVAVGSNAALGIVARERGWTLLDVEV